MKKAILSAALFISILNFGCGSKGGNKEQGGVKLETPADTSKLKTGDVFYQCDMHPEVVSIEPGKCPKCGEMELSKVSKK